MAMTARQVYEGVLTEMNKVQAPSMLLEDFNYFINKAVNQYINKKYNVYDVNQQSTDDLRVLKATMVLNVQRTDKYGHHDSGDVTSATSLYGATYEAYLPQDYLHMLNCICNYHVKKQFKCYDPGTYVQFGATRLTADLWGQIINNFYMKPSYKKPYYYLHNVNILQAAVEPVVPTNPYNQSPSTINGQYGFYETNTFVSGNTYTINGATATPVPDQAAFDAAQLANTTTYTRVQDPTGLYSAVDPTAPTVSGITYYGKVTTSGSEGYYVKTLTSSPVGNGTYVRNSLTGSQDGTDAPAAQYQVHPNSSPNAISGSGASVTSEGITGDTFNLPRTTDLGANKVSLVEKPAGQRLANASKVRVEIRTGKDDSIFELESIYIDYIKAPQFIRLTQEQIDLTEDTSQMMEFPDYVCQEIINELTHLIMENSSDPRLQSHMPVTMSIANPAQGQTSESSK